MTGNMYYRTCRAFRNVLPLNSRYNKAWDFHPQVGLIISGGDSHQNGVLNIVERSTDYGVSFQALEPLPVGIYSHCLAIVDETTVFVAGGIDSK